MITLPESLTAVKYNGYFWDVKTKELYSLKIAGELRKLTKNKRSRFNIRMPYTTKYYYIISVNGFRKCLLDLHLEKLKLKDSVIPTQERDHD